ncbi:MAG: polysaccharide deacetylase family protein [Pseudomonadota bacterium]
MSDNTEKLRKLVFRGLIASRLPRLLEPLLGGEGAILAAHRVTGSKGTRNGFNSHLVIHPVFLDELIAEMKAHGFVFVSMDEAIDRIGSGFSKERFAALTLDDAFRDNLIEALPVLEKHETPFTVYVAPGLTDGHVEPWWEIVEAAIEHSSDGRVRLATPRGSVVFDCTTDAAQSASFAEICRILSEEIAEEEQTDVVCDLARSAGIECEQFRNLYLMNWGEIATIAAHPLCSIGAHTVNHYNLKRLTEDKAFWEIAEAVNILNERLGTRPCHLAYPYGFEKAVGAREARLAHDAGFKSAVTMKHGIIHKGHARHLHSLPRISVNGRYQKLEYLSTMLSGVTTPMANRGRMVVTV